MFVIIDIINAEYIPTKFDNYLVVHEEPEHITYFRTNISAWTVLYMETFFFPLIDRVVCTIQSYQILDALMKYFALYHISYSGQLEIRLSV